MNIPNGITLSVRNSQDVSRKVGSTVLNGRRVERVHFRTTLELARLLNMVKVGDVVLLSEIPQSVLDLLNIPSEQLPKPEVPSKSGPLYRDEFEEFRGDLEEEIGVVVQAVNVKADRSELGTLSTQLAQTAKMIDLSKIQSAIAYGELVLPKNKFPNFPFRVFRDFDSLFKHTLDFNLYKVGYTEIHVNTTTGNDTSGDGTSGLPYRSLQKAIDVAEAGAGTSYIIKLVDLFANRSYSGVTKTITKNISIVGVGSTKTTLSTANSALAWTADGAGTWKAARSTVFAVFDLIKTDAYGEYIPLKNVNTLAECQAQAGTWYTDDTSVWVHTDDGSTPTVTTHAVCVNVNLVNLTITNNAKLYIENIRYLAGRNSNAAYFSGNSSVQGTFIANRCSFAGGNLKASGSIAGNALAIDDIKNVFLFNCIGSYGARDGFNYHYVNTPAARRRECLILEFYCVSYKHGLNDKSGNNNCTTAHEGVPIARIGCIGYESTGPTLGDVNGCLSYIVDCHMRDSLADANSKTKAAFYFDNELATEEGEAFIINSDGGGNNYSINSSEGFKINISNFRGRNVPAELNIAILD